MKPNRDKRGFPLVETILVITILAILAFGLGNFIVTSIDAWLFVAGRDSATGAARAAMDRMVAELIRIKKPQNILTSTASVCAFLDIETNVVTFEQSSSNLLRNGAVLAANLLTPTGLTFTYLDATGEATAVKQDMRSIRVWLAILAGSQLTTIESAARIRNLI